MFRFTSVICLLLGSFGLLFGQGSAAGVGQGGGGGYGGAMGGGGGLGGGRVGGFANGNDAPQIHPEDEPDDDGKLYETRTAILTPGDRVEYKIKAEKGTTLFAGATSEAFDPALAVEDATGKTLAKNDDREEGDQAPFVAVRFLEAGTYTLKVLSYKQASGGKFTLKLRTFVASDAEIGQSVHDFQAIPTTQRRVEVRIRATKGKVYDLREVYLAGANGGVPAFVRLVGPTGVERADYDRVLTPDGGPVFAAKADGDYYAEYRTYSPVRFATLVKEVPVVETTPDREASTSLAPGDLVLFDFSVATHQIVRSTLIGDRFQHTLTAPAGPGVSYGTNDPGFGYGSPWTYFLLDRNSNRDVVRIYRATGTARFAIRSSSSEVEQVTLRNSTTLPEWESGQTIKAGLDIGEVRLFLLKSANSELMRVTASSPAFKPRLDIFRLEGEIANTLPNPTKHTASDDLYFPKADTFVVRLSCDGYGGSGDVSLRRDTPEPTPYVLGANGSFTLNGANFGLYSVELTAGKRYQLTTDGDAQGLRTDLLDEEGTFLQAQTVRFDRVTVQYFVPNRSGRHRLWLRGVSGTRHFRLEPSVAPTVG